MRKNILIFLVLIFIQSVIIFSIQFLVAKRNNDEFADMTVKSYGFDDYGFFIKPSDFIPELPCDFWRDSEGDIQHNMDFSKYTDGTKIYVHTGLGSNSNNGLSEEYPVESINYACELASEGEDDSYCIILLSDEKLMRDEGIGSLTIDAKTIAIIPQNRNNKIIETTGQTGLKWEADGDIWKTSRSNTYAIFNMEDVGDDGIYTSITNVSSLAECKSTPNSWYTDLTNVYLNTDDGLEPSRYKYLVCVKVPPLITLVNGAKLYIENCTYYTGSNGDCLSIESTDETDTEFVANGCTFVGGNLLVEEVVYSQGLAIDGIKKTYVFDCLTKYNKRDGYNYHFEYYNEESINNTLIIEYNCEAKEWNYLSEEFSNNATSAHEGVNIIRFGSKGNGGDSPLSDVGGCYSICVDCEMYGGTTERENFFFGYEGDDGKAIIINCKSESEVGVVAGVPTYIYNFDGNINDTGYQKVMKE